MAENYDLVIVGGGTGGYVAAIRAAQNGWRTAIVEREKLGGTCLHRGCIPSKALLRSAEVLRTANGAAEFGVRTEAVSLDFEAVQKRKQSVVDTLYQGVQGLMKKGKIDIYYGIGRILGPSIFSPTPGTVSVELPEGENEMLIGSNVLIATGSSPRPLPGLAFDGTHVLSSDNALSLEALPSSIIIIGGGVIGIEWTSMLVDFGVSVTVVEYGERILPNEDEDISAEMMRQLEKRGVTFHLNARFDSESVNKQENGVTALAEVNGEPLSLEAEKLLVSVGRVANIEGMGLENTDIVVKNGCIAVNEWYQTKESHIYAIGDCIGGMQLAHVASHEGLLAVAHMTRDFHEPLDYATVPSCIYSFPESSSVGFTEAQAKEAGHSVKVGKFPFQAIGKALVQGEAEGFVKLIADSDNDDLLGVHIIGAHATDLISEAALAKVVDAAHFEIAETIHPHPTLSEIIGEAALAVDRRAIHM
ncbi:dihydrolipoyl dehydrogenase [Shouchella shacheensis]|uniref:dihydrolipoyl dehydrogenase n=1 Tax=Shouchella shacheensis TaxID=1649580 RepID=UPI000740081A|nr:dihydrolipoyl dehydrogenase [Shouchella shacheensis]